MAFFMAGYIVFLHSRLGKVYKDFNTFTQEASRNLVPILTKATEVMERSVQIGDEVAANTKVIKERQDDLISSLRTVIGTFIDKQTFWLFGKDGKASPVQTANPDPRADLTPLAPPKTPSE